MLRRLISSLHAPESRGDAEQEAVVRRQCAEYREREVGLGRRVHEFEDILRERLGHSGVCISLVVSGDALWRYRGRAHWYMVALSHFASIPPMAALPTAFFFFRKSK